MEKQKIRLLILYDFLQKNTDEKNPASTQQLISFLNEKGFNVNRKTLYEDIETLNEYGYEVLCLKSRSNLYYVVDRNFERSEVQILLSAIGATNFLSNKKTISLMEKLFDLLGTTETEQLQAVVTISKNKRNNEKIYYYIDAITTSIIEKKKLTFLYFDYDETGRREYRKDKTRYEVNPLGIAYSDDKLYLICYHDKYGEPVNYRIDRMDEVQVEEQSITYIKELENFDVNTYKKEQFSMFGGYQETIELIFPKVYLEVMIDRFGEDISICSIGNGEYIMKVKIQVSKTFFAWLTTFEGKVYINSPKSVKEHYVSFIKNISDKLIKN